MSEQATPIEVYRLTVLGSCSIGQDVRKTGNVPEKSDFCQQSEVGLLGVA